MMLLPQPFGEFARSILEKEAPVTVIPTPVIYLFAVGLPVACALYVMEMLWPGIGKNLLWFGGGLGILSLGTWVSLRAELVASLLVGQVLAFPGLAINSLAFAIICVLIQRRVRANALE